ncbi:Hypothetical predicted protein [Olea europaea subsp. europaea]|uniref:Uncharacterized protein n=1 Tax=Olea europaea subsp. europaea TaxID=158383 RepID=A0A8S0V486_OLEEU|nr:Hypothetical predicted protein [Olea europaea subsp. europaea]
MQNHNRHPNTNKLSATTARFTVPGGTAIVSNKFKRHRKIPPHSRSTTTSPDPSPPSSLLHTTKCNHLTPLLPLQLHESTITTTTSSSPPVPSSLSQTKMNKTDRNKRSQRSIVTTLYVEAPVNEGVIGTEDDDGSG